MKQPIVRLSLLGVGILFLCSATNTELNASTNSFSKERNNKVAHSQESSFLSSSTSFRELSSEEVSSRSEISGDLAESSSITSDVVSEDSRIDTSGEEGGITGEPMTSESDTVGESTSASELDTVEDSTTIVTPPFNSSPDTQTTSEQVGQDEKSVSRPPIIIPAISEGLFDKVVGSQSLSPELKVNQIPRNPLAGFELPLLSSYLNRNQAILVYESIKEIDTMVSEKTTDDFLRRLYQELFSCGLEELKLQETTSQYLFEGDSIYLEVNGQLQLLGLYLGDRFYVSIDGNKAGEKEVAYSPTIKKLNTIEDERILVRRASDELMTSYGQEVLKDYPASFNFIPNFVTQGFIERIGEDARALGLAYDVFPSVMIAQAILESGGGSSQLSQSPYHNLFGIKGSYQGSSVTFTTSEDRGNGELFEVSAAFRAYPGYSSSLSDYVQLIRGGLSSNRNYYEGAWRSNAQNYLNASYELTGKYATDTAYNNKVNSLIAAYHLTQYDEKLMTETGLFIQKNENIPAEYRSLIAYPVYDGSEHNTSGSYPVGECTWYAFNRINQLGMTVDDFMGNGGEWGNSARRLGYEVLDKPEAGLLISFKPGVAGSDGRYGHVAFVEAVGLNGILISEGNVYDGKAISYRVISNDLTYSDLVSYIKAPKK